MSLYNVSKTVVVNDNANFPFNYYTTGTGVPVASTALLGDTLYIGGMLGWGSNGLPVTNITRSSASRGKTGTKNLVKLASGTATEITVLNSAPANTKVSVFFDIVNTNWDNAYSVKRIENFKNRPFDVTMQNGETNATFLAKLHNAMTWAFKGHGVTDKFMTTLIPAGATVSGFYNDGTIFTGILFSALAQPVRNYTSITEIRFEAMDTYSFFRGFKVVGTDYQPSPYVTTFAPSQVVAQDGGIGNYNEMRAKRTLLATDNWADLFFSEGMGIQAQRPLAGKLYTEFVVSISKRVDYIHGIPLGSGSETDDFIIWINQDLTSCITDFADYIDRKAGITKTWAAFVATVYNKAATLAQFKTNV